MRSPDPTPRPDHLAYIRGLPPSARGPVRPPETPAGWDDRLAAVRAGLTRSLGRMPEEDGPLDPEVLGTLSRDGYAIERLTFRSRPGVRVTANLYRPDPAPARRPAVLSVHGHWPWARIDPIVQARCIGLARLGYVCLCVDAFGAGERAVEPAMNAYHGAMTGASLWPAGLTLLGLQVYDNRRAVDYLLTRPEVDPAGLAVTGASGGGNQSLYAGATDDRLAAVVPVCAVGRYEAYLGAACCVCEVLPGALAYATTGDLLAMIAPRALLVINASRDVVQFSPAAAAPSLDYARARYRQLGAGAKLKAVVIEGGHGYDRSMREAMYGWLDLHLRGRGDGSPAAEPGVAAEPAEALRCYPDGPSRPASIATIPSFALAEGRARLAALPPPADPLRWEARAREMRAALLDLLGLPPASWARGTPRGKASAVTAGGRLLVETEPGVAVAGRLDPGAEGQGAATLLLRAGGIMDDDPIAAARLRAGRGVVRADLRTTDRGTAARPPVRGVVDHDEAEWGLWVGRPLLGQWVWDVLGWLDASEAHADPRFRPIRSVAGVGPMAVVALLAAALDPRIEAASYVDGPVSLAGPGPWSESLGMGILAPGLLGVGDIAHLAALVAPRRLEVVGGVEPDGTAVDAARRAGAFGFAREVWAMAGKVDALRLLDPAGGSPR